MGGSEVGFLNTLRRIQFIPHAPCSASRVILVEMVGRSRGFQILRRGGRWTDMERRAGTSKQSALILRIKGCKMLVDQCFPFSNVQGSNLASTNPPGITRPVRSRATRCSSSKTDHFHWLTSFGWTWNSFAISEFLRSPLVPSIATFALKAELNVLRVLGIGSIQAVLLWCPFFCRPPHRMRKFTRRLPFACSRGEPLG